MLIFFQDIAKGVTGKFSSVEQFVQKLRPLMQSDSRISSICAELGVTEKNLNDPNILVILQDAMTIANLGTCIDETLVAANMLRQGSTNDKINKEIKKNRTTMQLLHGLLQGPYQSQHGYLACKNKIYDIYNMSELKNLSFETFSYEDSNANKALEEYIKNHPGLLIVTIVGKQLSGQGESNHVVVARTSPNGNTMDVLDNGHWKENLPAQEALAVIKKVYPENSMYKYHAVRMQSLPMELQATSQPTLRKS